MLCVYSTWLQVIVIKEDKTEYDVDIKRGITDCVFYKVVYGYMVC